MSKQVVIGSGLIATALKKKLKNYGWYPEKDTEIIYYFGGVTHTDFEKNPEYHVSREANIFLALMDYCVIHNIKLVYPSSALIYEKNTEFTRHKLQMEKIASKYLNTIGLRIFPVYGVGESKTVISKWCEDIKENRQPVVWGDGTQKRDFIYVDDVVEQILFYSKKNTGVYDIGSGKPIAFNTIIKKINKIFKKKIKPIYVPAPSDYSKGIKCKKPLKNKVSLEEGIIKICQNL